MNSRTLAALAIALTASHFAYAQDASYQSTTQITGGTLVDSLKQVSFISHSIKDMLAPTTTLTVVQGNQKAEVSKLSTEIIDLDKETITRIDNEKKTYTVVTFAQMRKAMQDAPAQMQKAEAQIKQAQAQAPAGQPPAPDFKMTFDVAVKNTGETKPVNGQMAQEQIVTLSMHLTDPNSPLAAGTNPVTYNITTDIWVAPEPDVMKDIEAFNVRFGQKLMQGVDMSAMMTQMKDMRDQSQAGMAQLFAGQPGAALAMKQMGEELAKVKGTRIMETTSMGGIAPAPPPGQAASTPPTSGSSVAGQVASDTATQTAAGESSKMGVFGNALTSSALGAFKRKPKPAPAAAPAAATGTPAGMQQVVLMATTTQKIGFSHDPVPASTFQVPAGYKKVEQPTY